ncbi:MAG: Aspartyl/glutamyl-tRNA(Asn/Gln) amidotransferase subunit B [Candidatus Woesebacteria bacterium GW2011_GWA1_37_7]|uniref:Aspartyl/glutamyl-tRNA(Asn/Gln) amidotransferase subunit B n=1 Tax=Candidatus Woesebacteria bacterium GW2011_GWA1_37_7 TaxID=1618545 RepID=A0A0G0H3N1_9BACT|nr:MAG: Aspartyl/glutamyl-tRNA(Asn/Gln) amidotransferase subunit B [Candidatus Woesebacteria bacterium GW2011_GWA1_37_7]
MKKTSDYTKPIIGLEVHAELSTLSKMFCGCPADHFAKKPNSQTCPVCLGLPGALPVPNKKAIEWTILIGLALSCKINKSSKFDRKHYFYPDLPKGYQISQYDEPLCINGYLDTSEGRIGITRVHLEEDTGKLQHKKIKGKNVTLIDFNRSGVPLVEIVTEPDIHSATQAKEFTQKLQTILRVLEVSSCDMEKGSMRLEANSSWGLDLGYKVEIKNINSFRFLEKAINYDLARQKELLLANELPKQETRGWNETLNATVTQRYKETASDYRYFPEPDIPPMEFSQKYIQAIKKLLPRLPDEIEDELVKLYKIRGSYASLIVSDEKLLRYSQRVFKIALRENVDCDSLANLIVNKKIDLEKLAPEKLIKNVKNKADSKKINAAEIETFIRSTLKENPKIGIDYNKGKVKVISVIVGKVMALSKGNADPKLIVKLSKKILN